MNARYHVMIVTQLSFLRGYSTLDAHNPRSVRLCARGRVDSVRGFSFVATTPPYMTCFMWLLCQGWNEALRHTNERLIARYVSVAPKQILRNTRVRILNIHSNHEIKISTVFLQTRAANASKLVNKQYSVKSVLRVLMFLCFSLLAVVFWM